MPPNRFICRAATSWPGWSGTAGIEHLDDPRMLGQVGHDPLGVVAVPVHPHGQRLQPAQHEPRVERAGDAADRVLVEADPLVQIGVRRGSRRREP